MEEPIVRAVDYTIWLDGTDGGLGHLGGSPNTAVTAQGGSTIRLPETWTSPSKYRYTLRSWYDITNSRYYLPGAEMEVTANAVLYADWIAAAYHYAVEAKPKCTSFVPKTQYSVTNLWQDTGNQNARPKNITVVTPGFPELCGSCIPAE